MEFIKYKYVYFIGIGGIGMSALARYFNYLGKSVSGYDRTETSLTKDLEKKNILIHYSDDPSEIPENIIRNKKQTLAIYTPAIPPDNKCLNYLLTNGYEVYKRSFILGQITRNKFTIAIAGTHGKTSTSAMITHILTSSGIGCFGFLGGISVNYNSNFISPKKGNPDVFVVEADEYDKSFLELSPDILIITSTDADHLDVYKNHRTMLGYYHEFSMKLKKGGTFIIRNGLKIEPSEYAGKSYKFGLTDDATIYAENISIKDGVYYYDLHSKVENINGIKLPVPGEHNILNSLAAYGATKVFLKQGASFKNAMKTFRGVKRRFEYIINTPEQIFIDDYAHHPAELSESISTLKKLYPGKKITGIFQPHLYSRTKDFYKEFARSLSVLDKVILLDIYPAREKPLKGVTSELIFRKLKSPEKLLLTGKELLKKIKREATGVLVTFGAGDIDSLVEPIKNILLG